MCLSVMESNKRIVIDPENMVGKPLIRGTRIPVELILCKLGEGLPRPSFFWPTRNLRLKTSRPPSLTRPVFSDMKRR